MTATAPPTPPTPPAGVAPGVGTAKLALAPLLVFAAAAAAAAVSGFGTYALISQGREGEGFESLGWAIVGAGVAVVVGLVVTIVGLVVVARRLFLPGHRAVPVVLAVAGPVVLFVLAGGLTVLFPGGSAPLFAGILPLIALATPSLAFLWSGSTAPTRGTLLRVSGGVAAVVVVGSLVLYVVADAREDKVAAELPLVLFDGTTTDSPYPDWRRDAFGTTVVRSETAFVPEGHEAYLKYFTGTGVAFLTMRSDVGECSPTPVRDYTCQVVGALPAGILRSYRTQVGYHVYPDSAEFLVLVYPDGSGVSVNVDGSSIPAQDILARLQRVDREKFEAATQSEFSLQ